MNLLITGGAGFIGSRFAELVALKLIPNEFDTISIVDSLAYSGRIENIEDVLTLPKVYFYRTDICNYDGVKNIIQERKIDVLVNFAAQSHVDKSIESSYEFLRTNVMGTQNLLDLALKFGINRYLQISTDEVYGAIPDGSWEEDEPLKPNSPYSASKAGADLLVMAYGKTHELNVGITRCCNNYGPKQFPEKIIPLFVSNLIDGKKVPIYGNGSQIREWIHVDDHCRGIAEVLLNGKPREIYNIAGLEEFTNLDLARKIISYFGKSEEESFEFVTDRKGHDIRYSLTGNKIKNDFGFKPSIEFDDGLDATVQWYQTHESWWRPLVKK